MPEQPKVTKATLHKMKWNEKNKTGDPYGEPIDVQFNPQTLKVSYANQSSGGDKAGKSAKQHIGKGTTKLSLDLWFDATVSGSSTSTAQVDDVRRLTEKVINLMQPEKTKEAVPPMVRFLWGTFLFVGVIDSINESLEYFSEDGKPLRASIGLSISSQDIQVQFDESQSGPPGTNTPGTKPQQQARSGQPLQAMAGQPWQPIATAHKIETPRHIPPGTMVNLDRPVK